MTFLTTNYHLAAPLANKQLEGLSRLSTVYGIRGIAIEGNELKVEYDASRIHEAEVLAEVRRAGINVQPEKPIPPGAFDHRGEFKDFAWPTTGVSPVNQSQK
ncbi:MAG: hypothetical protein LAO07_05790 [Acidobacteriia bacterium]|nr:hypothetical protein [Terriglobia bacterium]